MAASTSLLVQTRDYVLDAVDVGRFIYGLAAPASDLEFSQLGLRTALISLTSRLVHCKTIERGDLPESALSHFRPGMRIGVVPIGFADGLASWTCGSALVRGRRVPLIGEPSLEHARLDLTEIPDAQPADEVVFIGRQGNTEITAEEVLTKQRAENAPPGSPFRSVGQCGDTTDALVRLMESANLDSAAPVGALRCVIARTYLLGRGACQTAAALRESHC